MKVLLREAWARLKDANEHLGISNIKQETLPDLDLKTQKGRNQLYLCRARAMQEELNTQRWL